MKPTDPVVSVIIPAYNSASYIGEALDSVFGQTFRDYEIIVVNDGSPDTLDLEAVLDKYHNQISYIKHQKCHGGPGAARNAGIRCARGQFLAFLDADDIWLPDFLAGTLEFLEQNPSIDIVSSDCMYVGDPNLEGKSWQSLYPLEEPVTFETILPTQGGAFPSFVLLRRDTALRVGLFDEELLILEDYHYWLQLLYGGGNLAYLRKILGKRRRHPGSLTRDRDVILPYAIDALERLLARMPAESKEASAVRRELAFVRSRLAIRAATRSLKAGDYEGARNSFGEAYAAIPSRKIRLVRLGLRWAPKWTSWTLSRFRASQFGHAGRC